MLLSVDSGGEPSRDALRDAWFHRLVRFELDGQAS
jgi:hypothetical protein